MKVELDVKINAILIKGETEFEKQYLSKLRDGKISIDVKDPHKVPFIIITSKD
jgi:hypothetical protein